MANANPAQHMETVGVKPYKVHEMDNGCTSRTHYSWTLKQADRQGAIRLDEDGLVVEIMEKNLEFDLPKNVELEDVLHPDLLK